VAVLSDPATRPPLDPARLGALVPGSAAAGWEVEVLPEAGSTNALLAERARQRVGPPAREGTVLVTEHQRAGRGRLDRVWHTPPRTALTFSVLLRPRVPAAAWPWLPLLTGVAVSDTLAGRGVPATLKWPNDVLVALAGTERKIAGILLERVETPTGPAAVLGIGLNTDLTEDEVPVPTATSVRLVLGAAPDRTALLADLLVSLAERYAAWSRPQGAAELHAAYQRSCGTVGRRVRVDLPAQQALTGTAVAVDTDGRLVVQDDGGRRTAVGAGDVVHVRPVQDAG
jgi:BirA family biotin operon repressor/biotin-[acetyl-CoA-carboxylase] ligase